METQQQINGDAITVGGQKPMLGNSIDKYIDIGAVNIIGVPSDLVLVYTELVSLAFFDQ